MNETATLAGLAAKGDEEAFGRLVTLHYRNVYGIALAAVGRRDAAEDIAQEAFLLAWRNLGRLRSEEAFTVWMRRIARNVSVSWLRSARTRELLTERYGQTVEDRESPAATDRLMNADRGQVLGRALQSLPTRLREALVLFYLQEKDIAETAKALGISVNSVKVRLYQGRQRLRAHLEAELERGCAAYAEAGSPERARKRILAGLAAGPVLPELIRTVPTGTLSLTVRDLFSEGARHLGTALAGGVLVKAAWALGTLALLALLITGLAQTAKHPGGKGDKPPLSSAGAVVVAKPVATAQGEYTSNAATSPAERGAAPAETLPAKTDPKSADAETSIEGTVRDEMGSPIAGAEVLVMAQLALSGDIANADSSYFRTDLRGLSDAEGRYAVSKIPNWTACELVAHAAGYRAIRKDGQVLKPGQRLKGLDFTLKAGVTLRGRVVGRANQGVDGAIVRGWGFVGDGSLEGGVMDASVTDSKGWFSLGFAREGMTQLHVTCSEGRALFENVGIQDSEPVILQMPVSGTIYGRVTGPAGATLEGICVFVERDLRIQTEFGNLSGDIIEATVKTDANGRYEVVGVQPGMDLVMGVAREGSDSVEVKVEPLASGERRMQNLSFEASAKLTGRVTGSETGKPLVDVRVIVERDGETVANARTDATGRYEAQLNVPGGYFACPTYPPSGVDEVSRPYGKTVQVEAGSDATLDLQLPDAVTMSVRAVNDKGETVKDVDWGIAWCNGHGGEYGSGTWLDPDGSMTWTAFPPEREGWFILSREGYVRATSSRRIGRPGEVLPEEDVVLYPAVHVIGRLLGSEGEPVEGMGSATLTVEHPAYPSEGVPMELSSNGTFSLTREVPAGSVALIISAHVKADPESGASKDYEWRTGTVECRTGETIDLGRLTPSSVK